MNGRLHLGHGFSLSKSEFTIGYQRLLGKKALHPFGFHCTGMPIAACAGRLAREMETFGVPPVIPEEEEEEVVVEESQTCQEKPASEEKPGEVAGKFKSKKSKAGAKTGHAKLQWDILKDMKVDPEEIPNFSDPYYWLKYFPIRGQGDLKRFGVHVDWRRSFITTDVNPFYDSFVRWQFENLREQKKITFGSRLSVFSPLDGQPCADHDRATGEGVGPQEYTIIKIRILTSPCEKLQLDKYTYYLAAATLRPETMYGQTNCWLGPDIEYGAFVMKTGEVFICTERSMRNMAYQGLTAENGKYEKIAAMKGSELMGSEVKAPLSPYEKVYVLPLPTVSAEKGTGVVTSVPSDSPDDFVMFSVLKSEKKREYYGVRAEWVEPFDIVPIIRVDELGGVCPAKIVCESMHIKSEKEKDKLLEAHNSVYLTGFYKGILVVGDFAGQKVQDVKAQVQNLLILRNEAVLYSEPEMKVMSRSGDECVVAFTDQWYLSYGPSMPEWKSIVAKHVAENFECFNPGTQKAFSETVEWLSEWACSRRHGLGTRLPWDESWVIESLSDSTIYMAYYTVAGLLQGEDNLEGTKPGPLGIDAKDMTKEVWDYVFLGKDLDFEKCPIPKEKLDALRKEFLFWYPMDLRVSGKDLIQNHLTMCLYNHAAIFPDKMPRAAFCNGHVLVDGEKMSKSKGNFITLRDACEDFSADATRFALADAGDGLDDANFQIKTADGAILKLTKELTFFEETVAKMDTLRTGELSFSDRAFAAEMDKAVIESKKSFDKMMFREALRNGFYDLQSCRDTYRTRVQEDIHRDLIARFMEVQAILLAPFCPHWCDYVWMRVLNKPTSIMHARWPVVESVDRVLVEQSRYLELMFHDIRVTQQKRQKRSKVPLERVSIYVSKSYSPEFARALSVLRSSFDPERREFTTDVVQDIKTDELLRKGMKKIMPFVAQKKQEAIETGPAALEEQTPFDEMELLTDNMKLVELSTGIANVECYFADDESAPDPGKRKAFSTPSHPSIHVF
eukprot:TRINITY_DN4376_c0_g1_i1.p1 TRINITY_DN4376_c0_g1~~TRINITY_DN4376_c0_g1_i1.p1  ORF type:complete len:1110 (-),score=325.02 TRINITY_DN4376_c0_g1_i1:211-3249(-)